MNRDELARADAAAPLRPIHRDRVDADYDPGVCPIFAVYALRPPGSAEARWATSETRRCASPRTENAVRRYAVTPSRLAKARASRSTILPPRSTSSAARLRESGWQRIDSSDTVVAVFSAPRAPSQSFCCP